MSYLFVGTPLPETSGASASEAGSTGGLAIDLDRCIACRACEVHCQLEHDLGAETRLMRVISVAGLQLPFACAHCADPPCAAVCPAAAISKREDGAVLLATDKCIGCRFCIIACPYGSPAWDAGRGRMHKCDLCFERTDRGYWPACATKCSAKAIFFASPERIKRLLAENRMRAGGQRWLDAALDRGG